MRSYIDAEKAEFVIGLTHEESILLADGGTLSQRENPLWLDATVTVLPMAELDPDFVDVQDILSGEEWSRRVHGVPSVAQLLTNMDVVVYVPQEVPRFAAIGSEHIPRKDVSTQVKGPRREELLLALPEGGIRLNFTDRPSS